MKSHGLWKAYTPKKLPAGAPAGALFWKNAQGVDWYDYLRGGALSSEHPKLLVLGNRVVSQSKDATSLVPQNGCELFEADAGEAFEDGGVFRPEDEPAPSLPDLEPYQFRAMLKLSGKQDALYAVLDQLPEPQRTVAQSKLEYSLTFRRDNDLVALATQAIGLSDAELDELWLQAASIS